KLFPGVRDLVTNLFVGRELGLDFIHLRQHGRNLCLEFREFGAQGGGILASVFGGGDGFLFLSASLECLDAVELSGDGVFQLLQLVLEFLGVIAFLGFVALFPVAAVVFRSALERRLFFLQARNCGGGIF